MPFVVLLYFLYVFVDGRCLADVDDYCAYCNHHIGQCVCEDCVSVYGCVQRLEPPPYEQCQQNHPAGGNVVQRDAEPDAVCVVTYVAGHRDVFEYIKRHYWSNAVCGCA